eukprot:6610080-Lingulodinium_polyedra.AAC.1
MLERAWCMLAHQMSNVAFNCTAAHLLHQRVQRRDQQLVLATARVRQYNKRWQNRVSQHATANVRKLGTQRVATT